MKLLKMLKRVWHRLPLSDHLRWKITVLLLTPLLPFIRGSVVHTAFLREQAWQVSRIKPFRGDPFPVLPTPDLPDVLIWGIIDWRFRIQRPQHLARGLAAHGHRVFYLSTSFVNTRRPGFELERMDAAGRLFNVRLHLKGRPLVYHAPPDEHDFRQLKASLAELLDWTAQPPGISLVQHPYWQPLAALVPAAHLVYDCMDHHQGFDNTGRAIEDLEKQMLRGADAVSVTSEWLLARMSATHSNVHLIRNAAENDFFSQAPATMFRDPQGRKVLGYYGAISDWMDLDLLEKLAQRFPEALLLLVGADEAGAHRRLGHLPNVRLTGEVPYRELTHYLYGMDVCLLPFRIVPLTLATNPVKVYEYLAAGKPVVCVDLPELAAFDGVVSTACNHAEFLQGVAAALSEKDGPMPARRREFAAANTWSHRVSAMQALIAGLTTPLISIIVVTYNNLQLTQACLASLAQHCREVRHEIIVVDNASSDGSPEFLAGWASEAPGRHLIMNAGNRGFAAANNQGLAVARGDYLVLLNNDTEVTSGWLQAMLNHLKHDPSVGMIGPVTNNIGNEARIPIRYKDSQSMQQKARRYTLAHLGERFTIRTLAFFCVMMRRQVYATAGPLDEAFGLGFFEDDDYCRRVQQAGWKVVCAEDAFVHHQLSASFNKLGKERQALLEKNRKIYEAKWGPWQPHRHR